MLVEDLMAQLDKSDPKARVLIENTDVFLNGSYEALCVNVDKIENEVWIEVNYDQLVYEE
ncbi:hypothetical protein [Eubacterium ramulus]|uniref:hypothetical protein n=1 Tax=Eubacterium ramulus TaxID=39490 RepID=UPI00399B1DE9